MLSKDAKARYLKDGGNHCPFCRASDIEASHTNYDDVLSATVTCGRCHKTWTDIYQIADVGECDTDEQRMDGE